MKAGTKFKQKASRKSTSQSKIKSNNFYAELFTGETFSNSTTHECLTYSKAYGLNTGSNTPGNVVKDSAKSPRITKETFKK